MSPETASVSDDMCPWLDETSAVVTIQISYKEWEDKMNSRELLPTLL